MSITLSKFSSNQVPAVSSRGNIDTGDIASPYSFQEWIKRNVGLLPTQYVTDYNKYIQNWYKINANIKNTTSTVNNIKELYKTFIRQISISYKDENEERLFTDIDFNNEFELASVVPLISRKLKAIAAYYASKRDSVKPAKLKYNMTGTNKAIERILYQYILRSFTKYPYNFTVNDQSLTNSFSALSAICNNFEVQVEELYDENTYFDSSSNVPISAYDNFSTANTFNVFSNLTTDVLKALYETRYYDNTISESLISDLDYLFQVISSGKVIDPSTSPGYTPTTTYSLTSFIDYISGDQIKSYYDPLLASKYLGSDYYALSTDSLGNVAASGRYLIADAPYAHLNNRIHPTVAAVPSFNSLYSIDNIGGYHTPSHIGANTYAAVDPILGIDKESLSANAVYFIPDPNLYTSIRGTSLGSNFSPYIHTFEFSWIKQQNSNDYADGMIKNSKGYPIFKPYQSSYDSRKFDGVGIQRVDDNYQFWSGETASTWTRTDLYPLNWRGEYNIDKRTNVLDVSSNQLASWGTDIYGSNYGVYKPLKDISGNYISIYDRRHKTTGELWIRTAYDTIIKGTTALSSIYSKHQNNPSIYSELSSNNVRNFDVVYDVLIIELENYVILEKITFDYDNNIFVNTNTTSKIFNISGDNILYGGFWFHDKLNTITINMCISSSYGGIPYIYPKLYSIDVDKFNMEMIYSGEEETTLLMPTTATFTDIDAPLIAYNNDTDTFNITILSKDINKRCYIASIDISDRVCDGT